jgi:hypothetical protein
LQALLLAAETTPDFRVARAVGIESEMELPFADLHQLCGPMLGRLGTLPGPKRNALGVAFGLLPAAHRIVSWSAWPRWACCLMWPWTGRCWA